MHGHVVGLPGQGPDELRETLELIDACKPNFTFFYVDPWIYPRTPLEAMAIAEGKLKPDWNPLEITYYRSEHADTLLRMLKRYALRHSPSEMSVLAPGNAPPFGAFLSQKVEENSYFGPMNKLIQQVTTGHKLASYSMFARFQLGRLRDAVLGAPERKP